MEWKSYPGNRVCAVHPMGFIVIKPEEKLYDSVPLFCPVCRHVMKPGYDEDAYKTFQCCDSCASDWAYPNRDAWSNGWRPTPVEISDRKKNRML